MKLKYTISKIPMSVCLLLALLAIGNIAKGSQVETDVSSWDDEDVSGQVLDAEDGEPLIGVTILVKGTSQGTTTDMNGNFSFKVSDRDGVLVVSYVGYENKEIPIDGQTSIDIVLQKDAYGLEEMVVIGYGTARSRDVTGAVSSIRADRLGNETPNAVEDILRGNIAGLNVGLSTSAKGGGDLLVRGRNSLTADANPLIVLDGVIYSGGLEDINPNDIESIDVLKDASSAAVFGANAASGVILITTKKGSSDRPTIRINSNMGLASMSVHEEVHGPNEFISWREDVMKSIYAGGYEEHRFGNPGNLPSGITMDEWMGYDGSSGDPVTVWLQRLNMQPVEIENYKAGRSVNWYDMMFRNGLRQDHTLSLSGSTDELQYYWSLGYLNNEGMIVGDEHSTIRSRLNLQGEVSNFLTVGLNAQFADRDESQVPVDWGDMTNLSPWGSEYDENGEYPLHPNNEQSGGRHPYYDLSYIDRLQKETTINTTLFAKINLPFGIEFRSNFTPRYVFYERFNHQSSGHELWALGGGESNREQRKEFSWQVDNILSWNKDVADIHNFNVTLLANAEKFQDWSNVMNNNQFNPQDNLGYHNIGGGSNPEISSNDQYHTADALMGRVLYSLHDRYTVNLSLRRDGFSAFGQQNKRALFPSAAIGWLFTDESYFNVSWLDYGRLRLSYGDSGNRNIGRYSALSNIQSGAYFYQDSNGNLVPVNQLYVDRMSNENLRWERSRTVNAGLDFSLFENILDVSVEVYEMTTTDLLVERSLPDILGFNWVYDNLGEVRNRGVELSLNSRNLMKDNITWRTSFNFQLNRNEIQSLYGDMDEDGNELDDMENQWFIGHATDEIWHYQTEGIWQSDENEEAARYGQSPGDYKIVDVNDDGLYTNEDRQFLGYSDPRYRWSLRNEFKLYKNFDFSFTIYSHWGHKSAFNQLLNTSGFRDRSNSYSTPYWTEDNPNNEWARQYSNTGGAGGLNVYRDRSFIRLENISLAYSVPSDIVQSYGGQNVRFYMNVRNVGNYTSEWNFWDPEYSGPTPRYFTFGIDLTL
ncbi:MAG: SusC/RagA family TonB-linked outer membrane protein [Balneolales bacterium]